VVSEAAKDALARRQAQAALGLLRLGQPERVWPLLQHSSDPRLRTELLQRCGPFRVEAPALVRRLETEADVSARRALVLALGDYTAEQLPAAVRQPLVDRLLRWYRDDPDPGIHAAVGWLLRHGREGETPRPLDWQQAGALQQIDRALAGQPPDGSKRWYVNGQGQTLVLFPGPVEFLMGSPGSEPDRFPPERQHRRRIDRSFALGAMPVTVEQFLRFRKAHPEIGHNYTERYSPEPDGPIIQVTWYQAAQYCRWLSEQEGVPEEQMCYPPIAEIREGMKLPADYLARTGYRLPTEAEWEYACRARAATSRYYGAAEALLPRYAWYLPNAKERTWPVGQKRPNDFGLFDMHGNVWQWCQEGYFNYPRGFKGQAVEDKEGNLDIEDRISRVLRGGAFCDPAPDVRCSRRYGDRPSLRLNTVGVRVVRTYR
jgi:formylglycine-generating enzyme required for sulfatase activity